MVYSLMLWYDMISCYQVTSTSTSTCPKMLYDILIMSRSCSPDLALWCNRRGLDGYMYTAGTYVQRSHEKPGTLETSKERFRFDVAVWLEFRGLPLSDLGG